jgi:hypothetical protein
VQQDDEIGRRCAGLFGAHVDVVVGVAGIQVMHPHALDPACRSQQAVVDAGLAPVGVRRKHQDIAGKHFFCHLIHTSNIP